MAATGTVIFAWLHFIVDISPSSSGRERMDATGTMVLVAGLQLIMDISPSGETECILLHWVRQNVFYWDKTTLSI